MIPVRNHYKIYPECKEDFSVAVYYINPHRCRIRARRLDAAMGWEVSFHIRIDGEQVFIPASTKPVLEFEQGVGAVLLPADNLPQNIPKVIVQTGEKKLGNDSDSDDEKRLHTTALVLQDLNPEYEYKFFDAGERRNFIRDNCSPEFLLAYDTILPGAYKADLFRYCYLYKFGGCYVDHKMIARVPFREMIKQTDTLLICSDYDGQNTMDKITAKSYLNSLIMTVPGDTRFLALIHECVNNILQKQEIFLAATTQAILDLTGPTLMYKVFHEHIDETNIYCKHIVVNPVNEYKNFMIIDYTGRLLFTKTYTAEKRKDHYSDLWERKELFLYNRTSSGKYIIYVHPNQYKDQFEFSIQSRILSVKRREGWWLDLKVRIIDIEIGSHADVHVGRHYAGEKLILLTDPLFVNLTSLTNIFLEHQVQPTDINVKSIVVAVTSVIQVSDRPMGNGEARSAITTEERFLQTIVQLNHVREKIPNSTIIILEMSDETKGLPDIYLQELAVRADYIIRLRSEICRHYCHENLNKSLGEIFAMIFLGLLIENKEFSWFCKLNGRYDLLPEFRIEPFLQDVPVSNCIKGNGRLGILAQTVFYSIPKRYYKLYKEHFAAWLDPSVNEPVEHIYTMFLESVRRIATVPRLYIEGISAVNGCKIIL